MAYGIRQDLLIDADQDLRQLYQNIAQSKVPGGIDAYQLSDFNLTADQGHLRGSLHVHYQKRASTTVTCYRGIKKKWGVPYPKFERCDLIVDVNGVHAAGNVYSVIKQRIEEDEKGLKSVAFDISSDYRPTERPSEVLVNLAGLLTFSIGGKLINDQYRGMVSSFSDSIRALTYRPEKLLETGDKNQNIVFSPNELTFKSSSTGAIQAEIRYQTQTALTPSLAFALYDQLENIQTEIRECIPASAR